MNYSADKIMTKSKHLKAISGLSKNQNANCLPLNDTKELKSYLKLKPRHDKIKAGLFCGVLHAEAINLLLKSVEKMGGMSTIHLGVVELERDG